MSNDYTLYFYSGGIGLVDDPIENQILMMLQNSSMSIVDISAEIDKSTSSVSGYLKTLKEDGLLECKKGKDSRERLYTAVCKPVLSSTQERKEGVGEEFYRRIDRILAGDVGESEGTLGALFTGASILGIDLRYTMGIVGHYLGEAIASKSKEGDLIRVTKDISEFFENNGLGTVEFTVTFEVLVKIWDPRLSANLNAKDHVYFTEEMIRSAMSAKAGKEMRCTENTFTESSSEYTLKYVFR